MMDFVPNGYFHENLLFVKSSWIAELLQNQILPEEYPRHENLKEADVIAILKDGKIPKNEDWEILAVDRYLRQQNSFVCPLPALSPIVSDEDPCFAEVVGYVSEANFANNWREGFKKFRHNLIMGGVKNNKHNPIANYDSTLLDIIYRLYNCLIVDVENIIEPLAPNENILKNVPQALVCLISPEEIWVLKRHNKFNLHQMLHFSPAIINSNLKPLFLVYQILIAVNEIHKQGLSMGDINLKDIFIDEQFYTCLMPKLTSNLILVNPEEEKGPFKELSFQELLKETENCDNLLGKAVHLWVTGQLSNFDYILLLNYLSGRTSSNPNHHPVMPWIRDFSSQNGGWRDLTKSKYRLNKGDIQLDLTYETRLEENSDLLKKSALHIPHHVSDVLSEITYYVYKARQTPQSVLCKYVRNRWVPAEYPSSMQRLMEWTPDECIPEFFTDPQIFQSIHQDLADLELPSWCQNAEEFIQWHRQCLESPRVSEKLHSWIDLTFGYKLSGSSAIRAKNVCLNLVDNHLDLRDGGVIQLFNTPHPTKQVQNNPYWDPKKAPNLVSYNFPTDNDSESGDSDIQDEPTLQTKPICLPKTYEAMALIQDTEHLDSFIAKSSGANYQEKDKNIVLNHGKSKILQTRRMIRDMQVLGCLILEIFLPKKFLALGKEAELESRYDLARNIMENSEQNVPHCIRGAIYTLLKGSFKFDENDRYPIISEMDGLPPPSAFQFLVPTLSPFPFPPCFSIFARILRVQKDIEESAIEAKRYVESWTSQAEEKVFEVLTKTMASDLLPIIEELNPQELNILLPRIKHLYVNPGTAITMAWLTFEPLAKQLGPQMAIEHFLQPIVNIYENNAQTCKHLKLYHRTFLCNVMVRFGLRIFLKYFTENLIEAVGGYKDFAENREGLERNWNVEKENLELKIDSKTSTPSVSTAKTPNEEFTEGEVFAFDNEDEPSKRSSLEFELDGDDIIEVPSAHDITCQSLLEALANCDKIGKLSEGNISQVASESVIWLAHRLGPVLTAKYLSKNLLKMLNLCYVGAKTCLVMNDIKQQDFIIRVQSIGKTQGDILAHNVLECLTEIASIFGENVILLQYLPYAWDLISLCKKRLSPNLEGGLIGCVSMVHHMVPYLNDSILMNELTENFMNRLLFPVLQLSTSRSVTFSAGFRPRKILIGKLLDVTYMIGLRIGEEMARTHLTHLSSAFFSAFDKVYDEEGKTLPCQDEQDALKELQQVLTPDLAYSCYVAFYHLMGRAHLDSNIPNLKLIKFLCSKSSANITQLATYSHLRAASSVIQDSSASSGGNKILSSHESGSMVDSQSQEIHGLIKKEMRSVTRHLRGNWLAYWEHEIGRADKDNSFSLKQIKLQTFQGHSASVKSIYALDNENSFLSASRDKTVKVWSLRSQGDGTAVISPQWSYNVHKKSVMSVFFLDNINLAVSCDSTIHIWDPFVGTGVHQVDALKLGPVSVMTTMKKPSTLVLAATQNDSLLHLIDCRLGNIVTDLKVCIGSAGLIRCICSDPDGYTINIGHSSGFISQLDIRTGKLRLAWKAHEGEILTLTSVNNSDFVSTSLDQVVSLWNSSDGKIKCMLPGTQEPVHCVAVNHEGEQLITGSTGNRIAIRRGFSTEAPFSSSKLKSDILRGNLTSMKLLSLNRLLLLGEDTGKIRLIC